MLVIDDRRTKFKLFNDICLPNSNREYILMLLYNMYLCLQNRFYDLYFLTNKIYTEILPNYINDPVSMYNNNFHDLFPLSDKCYVKNLNNNLDFNIIQFPNRPEIKIEFINKKPDEVVTLKIEYLNADNTLISDLTRTIKTKNNYYYDTKTAVIVYRNINVDKVRYTLYKNDNNTVQKILFFSQIYPPYLFQLANNQDYKCRIERVLYGCSNDLSIDYSIKANNCSRINRVYVDMCIENCISGNEECIQGQYHQPVSGILNIVWGYTFTFSCNVRIRFYYSRLEIVSENGLVTYDYYSPVVIKMKNMCI